MMNFDIFAATDVNHVRIFMTLFCASLALLLAFSLRRQWLFFDTCPVGIYGQPQRVLGRIPLPSLSRNLFRLTGVILIASLVAASLGMMPRLSLLLALCCYFLYFSSIIALETVRRKSNLIPIVLFVLLVAPSVDADWAQATPQWPIVLVKIALVQMYFSGGIQKLRRSGLRWANGKSLQAYLVEHYLWADMQASLYVARLPRLCTLFSQLTLVFQLTVWVILIWPPLTFFYVCWAILFHIGTAVTMQIYYLKYLTPVYMVFATEVVVQLLGLRS